MCVYKLEGNEPENIELESTIEYRSIVPSWSMELQGTAVLSRFLADSDTLDLVTNSLRLKPMTCSWCNQKISFLRSLSDSRYCCDEHKKEEHEKCRELAIQRLRNSPFFKPSEQKESPAAEPTAAPLQQPQTATS